MKLLNIAFITALTLIPIVAQATDLPSKTHAPKSPVASLLSSKWDGFYAGGRVGYSQAEDYGREFYRSGSVYTWDSYQRSKPSGAAIGAALGFNKVISNGFVLGFELDLEKRSQNSTAFQYLTVDSPTPDPDYKMESSIDAALFTRMRLGYLINSDNTLLYISGGAAFADVKRSFTINANTDPSTTTDKVWQSGWTVGGGVEHFLSDKLSITLDYQYAAFGQHDVNVAELYGWAYGVERQDLKEHLVNFGLNYHF